MHERATTIIWPAEWQRGFTSVGEQQKGSYEYLPSIRHSKVQTCEPAHTFMPYTITHKPTETVLSKEHSVRLSQRGESLRHPPIFDIWCDSASSPTGQLLIYPPTVPLSRRPATSPPPYAHHHGARRQLCSTRGPSTTAARHPSHP